MSRLTEIMDQMTVVLNDLKTVMDAEQQQLSAGNVHGSALQRITTTELFDFVHQLDQLLLLLLFGQVFLTERLL